jgi:hypothetical protein
MNNYEKVAMLAAIMGGLLGTVFGVLLVSWVI